MRCSVSNIAASSFKTARDGAQMFGHTAALSSNNNIGREVTSLST